MNNNKFTDYVLIEADTIEKAKAGDSASMEIIVKRYLPYAKMTIIKIAQAESIELTQEQLEDMLQNVAIAFMKVVQNFK